MDYLLIIIVSFFAGWKLREWYARRLIDIMFSQAMIQSEQEEIDDTMIVRVEKHQDQFYVYSEETDAFITQGSNKNEIIENIKKLIPDKTIKIHESNLREVWPDD